jgi:hypothetical protein
LEWSRKGSRKGARGEVRREVGRGKEWRIVGRREGTVRYHDDGSNIKRMYSILLAHGLFIT